MNHLVASALLTYLALIFLTAALMKILTRIRRGSLVQLEVELVSLGFAPAQAGRMVIVVLFFEASLGVLLLFFPLIGFPLASAFLMAIVAVRFCKGPTISTECGCFAGLLTFGGSNFAIFIRNIAWSLLGVVGWLLIYSTECYICLSWSYYHVGGLVIATCALGMTFSTDVLLRTLLGGSGNE